MHISKNFWQYEVLLYYICSTSVHDVGAALLLHVHALCARRRLLRRRRRRQQRFGRRHHRRRRRQYQQRRRRHRRRLGRLRQQQQQRQQQQFSSISPAHRERRKDPFCLVLVILHNELAEFAQLVLARLLKAPWCGHRRVQVWASAASLPPLLQKPPPEVPPPPLIVLKWRPHPSPWPCRCPPT